MAGRDGLRLGIVIILAVAVFVDFVGVRALEPAEAEFVPSFFGFGRAAILSKS